MQRKDYDLKTILGFFCIPLFYLTSFYFFFGIVSHVIYNRFDSGSFVFLVYLPKIFGASFITFGLLALISALVLRWPKIFIGFFLVLGIGLFTVYIVQYYSLYYTNRYIIPEAFYHLDQIHLLVSPSMIIKLLVLLIILVVIILYSYKNAKWYRHAAQRLGPLPSTVLQIVVIAIAFGIPLQLSHSFSDLDNAAEVFAVPSQTPEISFLKSLKQIKSTSKSSVTADLPQDVQHLMESKFGLFYNLDTNYPQVKSWVYRKPLPFKKRGTNTEQPNIILFLVESLSSIMYAKSSSLGLTPNLDELANESMSVKGYFNHTFPTVNGWRGQLCSFYPVLSEKDHSELDRVNYRLLGLPHVLNQRGYETAFFTYSPARYTPFIGHTLNITALMRECGFSNLYMAEDIQRRLLGLNDNAPLVKKSINDLGLMVDLKNVLGKRHQKSPPFFYTISTIGTHPEHGDYEGKLLDSVMSFDQAFGIFWQYFKNSPYYHNTMVIVTADHAMPPTVEYKKAFDLPIQPNYFFEEIVLLVFDKRYELPKTFDTKASSLDLVPSVLQMLAINHFSNPFLGLSIFSDRQDYPRVLATMLNRFYINDEWGIREVSVGDEARLLLDTREQFDNGFKNRKTRDQAVATWYAYNQYLNNHRRIWNMALASNP